MQSDMHGEQGSSSPPSVAAPMPASPSMSIREPRECLPFDENCADLQAAANTPGDNGNPTYDELLNPFCRRGYARQDSIAVLKTRLPTMDAVGRKRACGMGDAMSTTER